MGAVLSKLNVNDLKVIFDTPDGPARAVDGVNLTIESGTTVALVGESGCGKSVFAQALLDLVPGPTGKIKSGTIEFGGKQLPLGDDAAMRRFRGNTISMIFQEPLTALNPVQKIGKQIIEALAQHDPDAADRETAVRLLDQVGIPSPDERIDDYPHQLSGGMLQRVCIAMAIALEPALLIADEPTTALDVTIQAQILRLLKKLQADNGMSILLITHDLGVVSEYADYTYVMYAGRIIESGPTKKLLSAPHHPYTRGLIDSIPSPGQHSRLTSIEGLVPPATDFPDHCRFADRCDYANRDCREKMPELEFDGDHGTACFYPLVPQGAE